MSFDPKRKGVVQRGVETQIALFYCCFINRNPFRLAEKKKTKIHACFKEGALWESPALPLPPPFHLRSSNFFWIVSDSESTTPPNLVKMRGMFFFALRSLHCSFYIVISDQCTLEYTFSLLIFEHSSVMQFCS